MTIKYPSTIFKGYAYTFFSFFGITSLWVIYLQMQGLNLVEIGLCESIFHVASFVFEVPSGVLADRFSYRFSLFWGRIASIVSAILILVAHSFWLFALSFVLSALSYNLQSGTIDALMYDSLVAPQQTKRFPNVISNLNVVIEFSQTAGVVIAGFLVHWHFELTYVAAILIGIFGLITVLLMKEPTVPKSIDLPKQTVKSIIVMAYRTLKNNQQLRGLMIFQAVFDGICTSYYFYFQSLMETHHFSGFMISLLMVISAGMNIVGIKLTPWIQKRLAKPALVSGVSATLVGLLLLTWINWIPTLTVLFLFSQLLASLIEPIFSSYYNEMITSQQRATLLSVASVLFSASMIFLFPLMGWLVQIQTFSFGFGVIGCLMLVLLLLSQKYIKKAK